jgi:hypothetical protein
MGLGASLFIWFSLHILGLCIVIKLYLSCMSDMIQIAEEILWMQELTTLNILKQVFSLVKFPHKFQELRFSNKYKRLI